LISGAVEEPVSWTWEEFLALPAESPSVDIHCVTKWSKLDTSWTGVSVDVLLENVDTSAEWVTAWSDGGYTTNLALQDVTDGKAWVAYEAFGEPLGPEHGGPARLLVPHLYFWKSAKWLRGLTLTPDDEPGFWETYGYHNHGDPWKEQRYEGDCAGSSRPWSTGADRRTSMRDSRYLSALATALRGTALPYGYTLTISTSGMLLTHQRGLPSVGEVFLFMIGAIAGFGSLGLVVRLTGTAPFEPSFRDLWRTGMIQLLAVGGALGGAALGALIGSGIAWPLGAFVATVAYLALATLELALSESPPRSRRGARR
jgi:hypothetical protein